MAWLVLLVLVAGLLMFAFCKQGSRPYELGRLMFFAALLAIMLALGPATVAKLRQLG